MRFRVRIDSERSEAQDSKFVGFFSQFHEYVLVGHILPHGNPHYHAFVNDTMSMSIDAFRKRVQRYFKNEIKQSTDYSVKKCDDDKIFDYVSYLFNTKQGNVSTLVSSVYPEEELSRSRSNAEKISSEYIERNAQNQSKSSKITIYGIAEEVYQMFRDTHSEDTIAQWTQLTITTLHKHRKSCEPNMLIKIVSTARSFKDRGFLIQKVQEYFREN